MPVPGEPRIVVTTAAHPTLEMNAAARRWAEALGVPCVPRGRASLSELCEAARAEAALVAGRQGLSLQSADGLSLRWHGSMGVVRVRALERGGRDAMVEACGLVPGDTALDATAGRCSDALVMATAVGEGGAVIAFESSAILHAVMADGLARAQIPVRLERADSLDALRALPDASVDVVYFDPMFPRPETSNPEFELLRRFADPRPLTPEAVDEARRVARRRVVLADGSRGTEIRRLGLRDVTRNRWAARRFGVVEGDSAR